MHSRLLQSLDTLKQPGVLVVGDLILDHYVWGEATRISPEAPIPVLAVNQRRTDYRPGGAANVAVNLSALGARVMLAGVTGSDPEAAEFLRTLQPHAIATDLIAADGSRPTTLKTRFMSGAQQMLRTDHESAQDISAALQKTLLDAIQLRMDHASLMILSDYRKGVLPPAFCQSLIRMAAARRIPVLVDPKGKDYRKYAGATVLTPNLHEAADAATFLGMPHDNVREVGKALCEALGCRHAVITMGAKGVAVIDAAGAERQIPAEARAVFDVTGAGDTFIATLGFCMAGGADFDDAVRLANVAAGIAVGRVGTAAVSHADIRQALMRGGGAVAKKVLTRPELLEALRPLRAGGKRIVFTNGCFDLLHVGHIRYLSFARNQGDLLVVGLNTDVSVRRLKGESRPLVPERERAEVLAALEDVDFVAMFDEDTPLAMIQAVDPGVLVKGEDYAGKVVVGREHVEGRGGRVILAPFSRGHSTSAMIARMEQGPRA